MKIIYQLHAKYCYVPYRTFLENEKALAFSEYKADVNNTILTKRIESNGFSSRLWLWKNNEWLEINSKPK